MGPVVDLGEVVFVDELGEGAAVVVADFFGGGGAAGDEFGEVGEEVVAAALAELGGEGGGPVGAVGFERVGEDGVGRGGAEGAEQGFADGLEVGGDGLVGEGVEHEAFGADGGAFDLLAGVGLDEEEGDAVRRRLGDRSDGLRRWSGGDGERDGRRRRSQWVGVAVDEDGGEEGVAFGELGQGDRGGVGGNGDLDGAEAAGGLGEGGVRGRRRASRCRG